MMKATQKYVAVLLGQTGVGKTSLYNKLCNKNHPAKYSKSSLTRDIRIAPVSHGDYAFQLLDTPGTNPSEECAFHGLLLREALTVEPLNAIFVIVQFSARPEDEMLPQFEDTIQCLQAVDYQGMLVVIVSKFDQCEEESRLDAQNDIMNLFSQFGVPKVIFNELNSEVSLLANKMFEHMQKLPPKKLKIDENGFLKNFKLCEETTKQKQDFRQFMEQENLPRMQGEGGDELVTCAISQLRYELEQIKQTFEVKYAQEMIAFNHYAYYIKLQRHIIKGMNNFRETAHQYMSYNPADAQDPRNQIRKCGYCNRV